MAILILCSLFLVGGVAVYVFSDDLPERRDDTKDFIRFLVYLPRLIREVEAFSRNKEKVSEEVEELNQQDVEKIAIKSEEIREGWLKCGGAEEAFVALEERLCKCGFLKKVQKSGARRLTWEGYLSRESKVIDSDERKLLDVLVACLKGKKQQDAIEKLEQASENTSRRVLEKKVHIEESDWLKMLNKIGLAGEASKRFQQQLYYRGIWEKLSGGHRKEFSLKSAMDLLAQERRFLWTSLGLVGASVLPFGLMYIPAFVATLSKIAPPVALLAGVVLGSYVELSHRLEMQRSCLRLAVLDEKKSLQGNTLQPIFIGLLLGHEQYRSTYGWGIPKEGWPFRSIKLELLMKIRVYVLAILSVLLVLLVSSLFARDSELVASLNPFIGYYTLLISFAMWTWVSRRGKLPVLRAKLLIYHPNGGNKWNGVFEYLFEKQSVEKFLSDKEFVSLQSFCTNLRSENPLFLEITARKSDYGFYNQKTTIRLFQRGQNKIVLNEKSEEYRLLDKKYTLKRIKDSGVTEEQEDLLTEAED